MQDVVSRAIAALKRRQEDFSATHPDNEAAFLLARYLQGDDIEKGESGPYAEAYFEEANKEGLLMCSDGEEIDRFTLDMQLNDAWGKVKVKLGAIYQLAIKQAKENGIPEKAKVIPDEDAQYLASVCRELQKYHGKEPFFLTQEFAGELIGKGRRAGAARLLALIKYGIISLHSKGFTGRSSKYYYIESGQVL